MNEMIGFMIIGLIGLTARLGYDSFHNHVLFL